MQNKTTAKNWNDVRLIFSSISIAMTLGFWGLFASHEKSNSGTAGTLASQPDPATSSQPQMMLLPGQKLLFGATVSQSPQTQQTTLTQTTRIKKTKGSGTITTTKSSRP